ncbi:MAG: hypothetical protein ABI390_00060 [Daejeonella sp.]
MKRILLLSLIALISVASCKKDKKKEISKPVTEQLKGTWLTISENSVYFDSSNKQVFQSSNTPGSKYIIGDAINRYNLAENHDLSSSYAVTNVNGKNYISFTDGGVSQRFEVIYVDTKMMTWKQETTNVTYNDNGTKTAAKVVYTINFHCPCRD